MAQLHFFNLPQGYDPDECKEIAEIINKALAFHGLPDDKAVVMSEVRYAGLSVEVPNV